MRASGASTEPYESKNACRLSRSPTASSSTAAAHFFSFFFSAAAASACPPVSYYDQWLGGDIYYTISPKTNWVVACGRNIQTWGSAGLIINGVVTSVAGGGFGQCELVIIPSSDWQLSKVYVWNRHLPDSRFPEASSRLVEFLNSSYDFYNFFSGLWNTLILDVKHLDNYYT
jgi:hypothetical protein